MRSAELAHQDCGGIGGREPMTACEQELGGLLRGEASGEPGDGAAPLPGTGLAAPSRSTARPLSDSSRQPGRLLPRSSDQECLPLLRLPGARQRVGFRGRHGEVLGAGSGAAAPAMVWRADRCTGGTVVCGGGGPAEPGTGSERRSEQRSAPFRSDRRGTESSIFSATWDRSGYRRASLAWAYIRDRG